MSTPFRLQLPRWMFEGMLAQARAELPNECCGFLAGRVTAEGGRLIGRVLRRYPLVNKADEPTRRYEADAKGLGAAARDMRVRGLDVLAIYHSHPTSRPVPSRTDLERNFWPGVVTLIISLQSPEPEVQGWWLEENDYRGAEWELVSEGEHSPPDDRAGGECC